MKELTVLTKRQELKLEEYKNKYLKLGLCTDPLTVDLKEEIKTIFSKIYASAGLPEPETFIFSASPKGCLLEYKKLTGKQNLQSEISNFCYGSQDAGWLSFYSFFLNETDVSGVDKVAGLIDLAGKCSFYIPYENVVFISQNLSSINMVNGRLHNTKGAAWEYSDGFCGYSLDGVAVSEDIIKAINGELPPESVLKQTNTEHRLLGIKYVGPERLLNHLDSRVLSTKGDEYALHEFVLEGTKCVMLEMQNPSEPKKHYEFVPPEISTVNAALAWRIGWDINKFKEPVAKT